MQTILGAGGAIGQALARELPSYTQRVRLVARHPRAVTGQEELSTADLLDAEQCRQAVAGSSVAYLVVGLPYRNSAWERDWPRLIDNVLEACAAHQTRLVFFDNVYLYPKDRVGHMTEDTPAGATTRKGKVRQAVAEKVLAAHHSGTVEALIARAADFYGPGIKNSVLNELMVKPIEAGKRPRWLCAADQPHNFTWTPDAAKATAQLGNNPTAYGRTWHLPTHTDPLTANEWAALISQAAGRPPQQLSVLSSRMIRMMGWLVPAMAAMHEMLYQYERPYYFDSRAFTERYGWSATPPPEAAPALFSPVQNAAS